MAVSDPMARAIRRLRDERGMTLSELLVAMFVFGIVSVVFTSTLASVQQATVRQDNLSRTNDQARLAMEQLDREIRSGNVLYNPGSPDDWAPGLGLEPYYGVLVYTQSNAPTLGGSGSSGFTCVLWKIDDEGQLLTQQWSEADAPSGSWRVVASGIVNKRVSPPVPAFELTDPTTSRTLTITLRVNDDLERHPSQTIEISEALTGRNTSHGYPATVCETT